MTRPIPDRPSQRKDPRAISHRSPAFVAAGLPAGYAEFLEDLKVQIREARMRAVAKLELVKWPRAVAKLTWGHNVILLEKCKDPVERDWYAQAEWI